MKPAREFYARGASDPRPRPKCVLCMNAEARDRGARVRAAAGSDPERFLADSVGMHGISADFYRNLLYRQGGACAICRRVRPDVVTKAGHPRRGLAVDHDHACCPGPHSCGRCVRGLLCFGCNIKLGHYERDPAFPGRASEYLRANPARATS